MKRRKKEERRKKSAAYDADGLQGVPMIHACPPARGGARSAFTQVGFLKNEEDTASAAPASFLPLSITSEGATEFPLNNSSPRGQKKCG